MENIITKSKPGLIAAGEVVRTALTDHALTIGLVHTTPAMVDEKLVDLIMACGNHDAGKLELTDRKVALRLKAKEGRGFATTTRDVLKPHLGTQYAESWNGSGFVNSLAIPSAAVKLQPMLGSLKNYLTLRPAQENLALNVTAVRADTLYTEIGARRAAISAQEATLKTLLNASDAKTATLRLTLRTLLDEMAIKMDPMDPLWLAFGFNMPGKKRTPDVPKNLTAVLIGTNAIAMKWNAAPRASHYRVWKKVIGVDADYVFVGNPADLDFTIEGLPGNAQVEVLVSAVNNGGESQKSTLVLVQTL
ncbi:MAG: fibronectin type III domain-containing protein [Verrucomicrobia bacterium]|nr:fibronectin type III domain-containing protein [Verrucomicrobiota bacterium]